MLAEPTATILKFLAKGTDNPLVDDLTREFLLESEEGLDRMERGLTELETRPADRELLAEIFRSVHTIKGTTGFWGFPRLEALAHAGENLLGRLREGRLVADAEIISGLLALLDRLRGILHSIKATDGEGEAGLEDKVMIARLEALQRNEVPAGAEGRESAASATARAEAALVPAAPAPPRRKSASRRAAGGHPVAPRREQPSVDPGQAGPQGNEPAVTPAPEKPEPVSASDVSAWSWTILRILRRLWSSRWPLCCAVSAIMPGRPLSAMEKWL